MVIIKHFASLISLGRWFWFFVGLFFIRFLFLYVVVRLKSNEHILEVIWRVLARETVKGYVVPCLFFVLIDHLFKLKICLLILTKLLNFQQDLYSLLFLFNCRWSSSSLPHTKSFLTTLKWLQQVHLVKALRCVVCNWAFAIVEMLHNFLVIYLLYIIWRVLKRIHYN